MRESYDELYAHQAQRGGPSFTLQHVVDAHAAQTATAETKPIALVFALIGLYLRVEKRYSGRQVQLVHMTLARRKHRWPEIPLPQERGALTACDVLAAAPGDQRDAAIDAWCESVWGAYHDSRATIAALLHEHGVV